MIGLLATLLLASAAGAQTNYFSKASATNFSDPASWGTNADGTGSSPASISSADNFTVSNSSALVLNSDAAVRQLTIVSGSLTMSANTLTVSRSAGNNSTLLVSGGTLTVSGGTITLNGNFLMSSGAFNQSGGAIVIDGNDNNTAASSVASGTHLFSLTGGTPACTAGTITIVDPPVNTYGTQTTRAIHISLSASNTYFTGTHTFILGDGVSTTPGNTDGFTIETFASSRAPINNVTVNAGSGTGRYGSTSFNSSTAWGTHIRGTLTINAGSEFRVNPNSTSANEWTVGSIVNNGTLTTSRSSSPPLLTIGSNSNVGAATVPSVISGSGLFRNLATSPTAAFNTLVLNNPTGITFSSSSLALGTYTGHIAATLNVTAGAVNLSGQTLVLGISTSTPGSLSYTSGGFYNGTLKRWLSTTTLGTTYSTSTPTFPFLNSSNQARHIYLFRSAVLSTGGTLTATYADVAGTTGVSVTDGAYSIDTRYNTAWTLSTGDGFNAGSATFTLGLAGEGIIPLAFTPGTAPRIMQTSTAAGTHQAATGTTSAPIAARTGLAASSLTATPQYLGLSSADVAVYTVQSGNWEDGTTWNTGVAPTSASGVQIMSGHTVTINGSAAAAANLQINGILNVTGSSLTLTAPAASGLVTTITTTGQLNINGGTVNIGTSGATTRYAGLQNNGTFSIASGNLNVYGYFINASGSFFTQSGGAISVDQNAGGTAANSYTAGAGLQLLNNATNITISGGSITIVDPNAATSTTAAFIYSGTGTVYAGTTHTFQVGNGASTDAGGATAGYRITPGSFIFGNFVVDALAGGTNRSVSTTTSTYVRGNLTVTSGELSASSTLGVNGNILNNGTLTITGTLSLNDHSGGSVVVGGNAQTIGGSGTFRNSASTVTANVASLTVNNNNSTGVTLNVPLAVSGTLTMTSGLINTSSTSVLTLGTATAAATLSGTPSATNMVKGPFALTVAASQSNTSTAYVFPIGKTGYNNLDIVGPQTSSGGAVTIQAEVFDGDAGGTPSSAFSSLSNNRYWQVQVLNGAANLTGTFVRLNDTRGSNTGIARSATQNGTYSLVGGSNITLATGAITSGAPGVAGSSLGGYYVMGVLAPPVLSNLSLSPSTPDCNSSVARSVSVSLASGTAPYTVVLNYTVNGTAQTPVTMTTSGGGVYTATLGPVNPANAIVGWSVTATDANALTATLTGTSYQDAAQLGAKPTITASAAAICSGAALTLTVNPNASLATQTFETFPVTNFSTASVSGTPTAVQNTTYFAQGSSSVRFNTTSTSADVSYALNANVNLLGFASAQLTFSHIAGMEFSGVNTYDYGYVQYSTDGGSTWTSFPTSSYSGSATLFNGVVSFNSRSYPDWITNFTGTGSTPTNALWKTETLTIPAAAMTSQFRIRFRYTTDGSTNYYGWMIDNVAVTGVRTYSSYLWSDGNTTTTTTYTINPTSTAQYGVIAIDANNCLSDLSDLITVTANPLPNAPTGTNSLQCGSAAPAATVSSNNSGFATHTFKWYSAASGGTALQSSTSTTFTGTIGATTTFYVSEVNPVTSCESDRTPVTVTVTNADPITASTDLNNQCPSVQLTLSVAQTGSTQHYTYTWTAAPATGSGIATSLTGASVPVTPTLSGNYVYTVTGVDGSCSAVSTVNVTVAASPAAPQITASLGTVCAGSPVTLTPNVANFREPMETFPLTGYTVSGGTATQNTTYQAQGTSSVLFNAGTSANATLSGTTNMDLSGYSTATLVFSHQAVMEGPTTSYDYGYVEYSSDGGANWTSFPTTSYAGSGTLMNGVVSFSTKSYDDWIAAYVDASALPSNSLWKTETINIPAAALTSQFRIRFRYTTDGSVNYYGWLIDNIRVVAGPAVASYVWSTGATSTVASPSITVNPSTTTVYSVAGTNVNGCTGPNGTITINVNPLPSAPTATGSTQCGTQIPTASVTSTSGLSTPTFKWYDAASGGNLLQTSTSTTYTSTVSATTTFYVAELNTTTGCEGSRTAVTVTVNQPDAVTASGSASVCLGNPANLSVAQTGSNNTYTYAWTASPASGSGITGSVSGAAPNVIPTAAGTYVYTVTATDGGCITTSTVNVTVNAPAAAPSVVASATTSCSGTAVTLTPFPVGLTDAMEASSFNANGMTNFVVAGTGASATRSTDYFAQGASSVRFAVTSDDASATLTSSANINLAGLSSAQLTFAHQALMEGPTTSYDYGYVEYSSDGGANWTTFPTSSYTGSGTLMNSVVSFSTRSYPDWITAFTSSSSLPSNTLWKNETINIPAAALTSQFRIRFRYATDVSTTYYGWMIDNVRIAGGTTVTSYLWSTGDQTTAAAAPLTVNPTATTTYYVQAGDANGCYSALSSGVTVTVNPLPSAPTATGSTQCGTQIPTASVASTSGLSTPTFKWYDAASGGNLLQTSTSTTYGATIPATTTLYVSELNTVTGCESARTPVTITVSQPDAVTASANGPICLGASINLSATKAGSTNTYTYAWTATPASGSGITSPVAGSSTTVTPTAAGTFAYLVTATDAAAGCATTSTVNVTVNPNPAVSTVTSSAPAVCPNGSLTLSATSLTIANGTANVGTQTTTSITGGPYRSGLGSDYKVQYLFTAAELSAAGLHAGNITSIAFMVTSLGSGTMSNFTIKMGQTSATSATATFNTATLTTVLNPVAYVAVSGVNTHTFDTPFNWDGSSSLIVQVCHDAANSSSSTVAMETPAATSVTLLGASGACSATSGSTNSDRPIVTFGGQVPTDITGNYNWVWTPGNLSGAVVNATAPNTHGTVTYTATATNPTTGCSASGTVNVTVGATLLASASSNPTAICVGGSATLTAVGSGGGAPYTYSWKDANNTLLGTATTLTVSPTTTATYTVTVTDYCGTTATANVTVTVNQLPTITLSPNGSPSVCAASQVLTPTTNAASPSYQWIQDGNNITTGGTGATYTATVSGAYSLKVTDGVTTCVNTSAATNLTLQPYPASITLTPSGTSTICLGSSQSLTASASITNNVPSAPILSENFNGSGPYNFTVVNGSGGSAAGAFTVVSAPYDYGSTFTGATLEGSKFIIANSDAAGSGSSTRSRLVSNSFSTVGYSVVAVSFKHFFRYNGGETYVGVEYSTDNGATWTTIPSGSYTASTNGVTNAPPAVVSTSLNLPAAALNQPNVKVRFRYDAAWDWYWAIDDIQIKGGGSSFAWSANPTAGLTQAAQSASINNNSISVTPTAAGTYTYTVTASAVGISCANTSTLTLNVLTPSTAPAMLNSSAPGSTCAGSNVILTQTGGALGNGAHWQWYKDAAFTQAVGSALNSANAQITVAPTSTTTYYLRSEGGTAPCASNVAAAGSVTVTVRAPLSASIAAANPVQCELGQTATLNISNGPANGSVTVTTNGTNAQTVNLDASGNGTFVSAPLSANATFTITSVSDATCTTTISASATVFVGTLMANPINNLEACANTVVGPIAFTGNFPAGTQYSWTTTNGAAIGMTSTSGTGTSLPAFTAVNTGTTMVYTDVSVTPIITGTDCKVRPMVFRIFVKPVPVMNGVGNQVVCAGAPTTAVNFSSSVATATYVWTNTTPAIGLAASGGGNIPSFTAQNSTASTTITATVQVTPLAGGCAGVPTSFTYTVNRGATSISYANSPYCQAGSVTPTVNGTRGGTFTSTAGLVLNPSTGVITLSQSTPGTYVVTYTTAATVGGCGNTATAQVTIKPQATVNGIGNQVYCNGMVTAPIAFTGTAASYSWVNDNPAIGLAASGTGTQLPSFTTVNAGPATAYGYVKVTPLGDGITTCPGKPIAFRFAINYCGPIAQSGGTGATDANARMAAQVVVGPNPAQSRVTVQYSGSDSGPFRVELLSQQGQVLIRPVTFTGTTYTLDLTGLTAGTYVLRLVNTRTGTSVQKQVIKL